MNWRLCISNFRIDVCDEKLEIFIGEKCCFEFLSYQYKCVTCKKQGKWGVPAFRITVESTVSLFIFLLLVSHGQRDARPQSFW